MAIHPGNKAAGFTRPQQQLTEVTTLPAPTKGMDVRISLGEMTSANCIFSYNLIPSTYGMEVRPGYSEWQIGVESADNLGIKTLIWFEGTSDDLTDDKL